MGEHAKPQTGVHRRLHLNESVHRHCTDFLCDHTVHPVSVNGIGAREVLLQDSPCYDPNLYYHSLPFFPIHFLQFCCCILYLWISD